MPVCTDPRMCVPAFRSDLNRAVLCAPDGGFCLNSAKSYDKWYVGGFVGPNKAFPATIPANQMTAVSLFASQSGNVAGNLSIAQLIGKFSDRRMGIQLYSPWLDRAFSSAPVPADLLLGLPNFPSLIAGNFFVKAGTSLQARVTDYSGSNQTLSMVGRGFRHQVQQGSEARAQQDEQCQWNKYRSFLPYVLVPVQERTATGVPTPFINASGQSLSGPGTTQFTLPFPTTGDFYPFAPLIMVTDVSGHIVNDLSSLLVTSWADGSTGISIVDPTILPLPVAQFFSQVFSVTGFGTGVVRATSFPGGWGGSPWNDSGQWTHRIHRGTLQTVTIKNTNMVTELFYSIAFPGFLATVDSAEGEFLAFPPNQGQLSRNFQQQPPGSDCGPSGPCPAPPSQQGRVIVGSNAPATRRTQ